MMNVSFGCASKVQFGQNLKSDENRDLIQASVEQQGPRKNKGDSFERSTMKSVSHTPPSWTSVDGEDAVQL